MALLSKLLLVLLCAVGSLCATPFNGKEAVVRFYQYLNEPNPEDTTPPDVLDYQDSLLDKLPQLSGVSGDLRVWHWLREIKWVFSARSIKVTSSDSRVLWGYEYFNPPKESIERGRLHVVVYTQAKPGGSAFKVVSFPILDDGRIFLNGIMINGIFLCHENLDVFKRLEELGKDAD